MTRQTSSDHSRGPRRSDYRSPLPLPRQQLSGHCRPSVVANYYYHVPPKDRCSLIPTFTESWIILQTQCLKLLSSTVTTEPSACFKFRNYYHTSRNDRYRYHFKHSPGAEAWFKLLSFQVQDALVWYQFQWDCKIVANLKRRRKRGLDWDLELDSQHLTQ